MTTRTSPPETGLRRGPFSALFWTQFLGAFNDNLFKNALVIALAFGARGGADGDSEHLVTLAGAAFIFPFFILSGVAGQLADRLPKGRVVRWVKVAEVLIMLLGALGFALHHTWLLFVALGLMGIQSAMFGPLKYGLLPELLSPASMVAGNAKIEMGTFLAILLGTIAGGMLVSIAGLGPLWVGVACVTVAGLGLLAGVRVPEGRAAAPELVVEKNPIPSTIALFRLVKGEPKSVMNSILGISFFWMLGAVVLSILPTLVQEHLGGDEHAVTYLLALFSVGVAVGSLLCERFSDRQLELGLVPIGSLGITVFLLLSAVQLGQGSPAVERSLGEVLGAREGVGLSLSLACFAISSGLFIVPLYTLMQERSSAQQRARVIAANNMVNALFMVAGAGLLMALRALGATMPLVLSVLALLNLAVALYIYTLIPEFLFRFICYLLGHVFYRLQIEGKEQIPTEGPCLLVCNHVTFIDWLLLSSASQRPMRFVMHYVFLKLPLLGWFFRDAKVIPIAGAREDGAILQGAFDRIESELAAGELVCIFPEGALTRDGEIHAFRQGVERILERTPVPVVPMHLQGLWGSAFSRHPKRRKLRPLRRPVRLRVGSLVPAEQASAAALEQRVRQLGGEERTAPEPPRVAAAG